MNTEFQAASQFSHEELAAIFAACFANYFVPLNVDASVIGNMARRDSVDLAKSLVAVRAGQPVGFALLARRGNRMRVAAMGVKPDARRSGIARRIMDASIEAARESNCCEVLLEVITANEPAVRLYESLNFCRLNTLWGFTTVDAQPNHPSVNRQVQQIDDFSETTPDRVAEWITAHGEPDFPWQINAETIRVPLPGCRAFEWRGHGACLVANPDENRVGLLSLVVHREKRRAGIGRTIISELLKRYPGRTWRVPELVPAGGATAFLKSLGWKESAIQQFQMCRHL